MSINGSNSFFLSEDQLEEIIETLAAESIPADPAVCEQFMQERHLVYKMILSNIIAEPIADDRVIALWNELILHKYILSEKAGRNIGLRVSALDYLFNVNQEISNPTIIENSLYQQLVSESQRDYTTGLYNARTFHQSLDREIDRARRYGLVFSVAIFDLDYFKQFNDTLGHLAGNTLLETFSNSITSSLRGIDLPARFGGDEFCVLFPQTFAETAKKAITRLQHILKHDVLSAFPGAPPLSLSAGIAMFPFDGVEMYALLRRADAILYEAKNRGRNRIMTTKARPVGWKPAKTGSIVLDGTPIDCSNRCMISRNTFYIQIPEAFNAKKGRQLELIIDAESGNAGVYQCTPSYKSIQGRSYAYIPNLEQSGDLINRILMHTNYEQSFEY